MIKRAFTYARQSTYDGPQLDLKRYGASVWWQGKGGLGIRQLVGFIKLLLSVEESPDIIVVHCGGNDIGSIPALQLRLLIIDTLDLIKQLIPGVSRGYCWCGRKYFLVLNGEGKFVIKL